MPGLASVAEAGGVAIVSGTLSTRSGSPAGGVRQGTRAGTLPGASAPIKSRATRIPSEGGVVRRDRARI